MKLEAAEQAERDETEQHLRSAKKRKEKNRRAEEKRKVCDT